MWILLKDSPLGNQKLILKLNEQKQYGCQQKQQKMFKKEISLYETIYILIPNLDVVLHEWTNVSAE